VRLTGLEALQAQAETNQALSDRESERTGRRLEVPAHRLDPIAGGDLPADHVIQHSFPTSDSLVIEHLDVEKLSVEYLDVKRFELE